MSNPAEFIERASYALLLVPLFPLLGAFAVYLIGNNTEANHRHAGWIATAASLMSFFTVAHLFSGLSPDMSAYSATAWHWFAAGNFSIDFSFLFDRLAATMCLVVTGVGTLIHLYAIGYMDEDKNRPRFFVYLNLFLFSMLLLVLGDNLLVMFVGWEGVGVCSYLLIGFWFSEMENAKAGQKAFVVNRIGDAGFLLGMFTIFSLYGTLEYSSLASLVATTSVPAGMLEVIAILLFIGAIGKSAQIPLYVWLPDAMAGPTPVSALIHAATMVTAGIYMLTRMSFIYALAPITLTIVLVIGTLTAFVAATIALAQNDIKKVLAYSTVSQLGYMFMACGVAAFSNGIYHVVTHAFFKACLFMGAGSVIIGCHHMQDMREFGGLRKTMPLTFITYFISTLAIAGFPFTSGFFSKDAVLWTVFSSQTAASEIVLFGDVTLTQFCWGVGLFTALLTAFYMTRSLMLTFFGEYRGHAHPHESPVVVTLPLLILAALALAFGFVYGDVFSHYLFGEQSELGAFWTRTDMAQSHDIIAAQANYHLLEYISMGVAVSGILLAVLVYRNPTADRSFERSLPRLYKALSAKWWVDEFYTAVIIKPLGALAQFAFKTFDRFLIDGTVNGTAAVVEALGGVTKMAHAGRISSYAISMLAGAVFLIIFWLLL